MEASRLIHVRQREGRLSRPEQTSCETCRQRGKDMSASTVSVNHEWGALREVIVGVQPRGTMVIPTWYDGFSWMGVEFKRLCQEMGGRRLAVVDPAFDLSLERQTDALAELLTRRGVRVHRG